MHTTNTGSAPEPVVRFAGAPVDLGGTTYIVPPLSLGAVKRLLPKIRELSTTSDGLPQETEIDIMLEVCHQSIARNYPALTRDELEDIVDLGNVKDLFAKVMGQSGLVPAAEGNSDPGTGAL